MSDSIGGTSGDPKRSRARTVHEFKNHLTIILGFADLLLADDTMSARHRGDLEEIRLAAQRALALMPEVTAAAAADDTPAEGDE